MNSYINQTLNIFTPRELAILGWLIIFLCWTIFKAKMDDSLKDALKSTFQPLFVKIYFAIFSYWALITFLLYKANFWEVSLLKDSIFWLLFTGYPFCFKVSQDPKYLYKIKKTVIVNFKVATLFDIILNTYTLNFWMEFCFIIPFTTVLVTLNAFSATKEEYKPAKNFTDKIIQLLGLATLYYFFKMIYVHFTDIKTWYFAKELILPFVYTIAFIIPSVCLKAYSDYEWAFLHLQTEKTIPKVYFKIRLFLLCWFSFKRLGNVIDYLQNKNQAAKISFQSIKNVNAFLSEYLNKEHILTYDSNCIGFNPKQAALYLKEEGLVIENYRYLDSYSELGGYSNYCCKKFDTGETILYSMEGNNQEVQKLYLNLHECSCILNKPQNHAIFVAYAKMLYEKAMNLEFPKEIFEALKKKESKEFFIGEHRIILKKENYGHRKNLAYYEFTIIAKKPKISAEYIALMNNN